MISAECNVDDVNIDLNMLLVVKISYHNNEDVFDKLYQPDNWQYYPRGIRLHW